MLVIFQISVHTKKVYLNQIFTTESRVALCKIFSYTLTKFFVHEIKPGGSIRKNFIYESKNKNFIDHALKVSVIPWLL